VERPAPPPGEVSGVMTSRPAVPATDEMNPLSNRRSHVSGTHLNRLRFPARCLSTGLEARANRRRGSAQGSPMQRAIPIGFFTLGFIAAALTACAADPGYVNARSRGISADIDAVHWDGPTLDNPGETIDLRGEPKGAVPWHID
jgi:hypothetical protein